MLLQVQGGEVITLAKIRLSYQKCIGKLSIMWHKSIDVYVCAWWQAFETIPLIVELDHNEDQSFTAFDGCEMDENRKDYRMRKWKAFVFITGYI